MLDWAIQLWANLGYSILTKLSNFDYSATLTKLFNGELPFIALPLDCAKTTSCLSTPYDWAIQLPEHICTSITLRKIIMPCFLHCLRTTCAPAIQCEKQSCLAFRTITTHTKNWEEKLCLAPHCAKSRLTQCLQLPAFGPLSNFFVTIFSLQARATSDRSRQLKRLR